MAKPRKIPHPPATLEQKRAVMHALHLAPFFSYPKIAKRFGLTKKQVFDIAKKSGLSRGIRVKPWQRLPHFRYYRLIYKLDNYREAARTSIFHKEGFDHQIQYHPGFEDFCERTRNSKAYRDWRKKADLAAQELMEERPGMGHDWYIKEAVEAVEGEIGKKNRKHLQNLISKKIDTPEFDSLSRQERERILRRALQFTLRGDIQLPETLREKLEAFEAEKKTRKRK